MLTQERAESLAKILNDDTSRAKSLLALESSEALKKINDFGYDFTLDEINEFGEALRVTAAKQKSELDMDALDEVAGGIAVTAGIAIGLGVCFVAGAVVGYVQEKGTW